MKKKVASILLMLSVILGTCACDKQERTKRSDRESVESSDPDESSETEDTDETSNGQKETGSTKESKETDETEDTRQTTGTSKKGFKDDEKYEGQFWSAYLPTSLQFDEDNSFSSSKYCYDMFRQKNSKGEDEGRLTVSIAPEEAKEFRKKLMKHGIDLNDLKDGKVPTIPIGGLDFVSYSTKYEVYYLFRNEKAGIDISIDVHGEVDSIDTILDSMRFSLPDGDKKDPPYPWEGEALKPKTAESKVGQFTIKAIPIIPEHSFLPMEKYSNKVVVVGKTLYALSETNLNVYAIDGTTMKLSQEYKLEKEYSEMCRDQAGNVYVSSFLAPMVILKNGKQSGSDEKNSNKTVMAPDGTWGICYFLSFDALKKVTYDKDGNSTIEPFECSNKGDDVGGLESVSISKDHILLGTHKGVFVYDYEGKLQLSLLPDPNSKHSICSYEAILETDDCYLALDDTSLELVLWDKKGNYIGAVSQKELFDANRPWASGIVLLPDGSIYVSLVDERADESWDEYMAYRIKISH